MLHTLFHNLKVLFLGRNLWIWVTSVGVYTNIAPLENHTMESLVIPQIFQSGVPSFLISLLPTDCQKVLLPQVGISKFDLPLEILAQVLCFTL